MSTALRHTACMSCRERKIKCDGNQPSCARCLRKNQDCVYKGESRIDLSQTVLNLSNRLAEAESALRAAKSCNGSGTQSSQFSWHNGDPQQQQQNQNDQSYLYSSENLSPSFQVQSLTQDSVPPLHSETFDDSLLNFSGELEADIFVDHSYHRESSREVAAPVLESQSTIPTSSAQFSTCDGGNILQQPVAHYLRQFYLTCAHPVLPMINKERFLAECELETMEPAVELLHSAVCTHAASLAGTSTHVEEAFYDKSRQMLRHVGTLKDQSGLFNICTIQAYVILGSYEIKRGHCLRSCGTIHRASWVARLMKLHLLDSQARNLFFSTLEPARLEEYRTTFWALVQLRAFTSVIFDWQAPPDYAEICTQLPSENIPGQSPRTTLNSLVLAMSIKQTQQTSNLSLAPLGIAVISTSIAGKCVGRSNLVHGLSAEDNGDHDFWTQHFQLDETIRDALSQLVLPTDSRLSIDSNIWLARITLQAAMICLHQAAMKFAKMTQVPAPMVADSPARSMNAALDISTITKQIQSVPLSKMNTFAAWPVYTAAQLLIRALYSPTSDLPRPHTAEPITQVRDFSFDMTSRSTHHISFPRDSGMKHRRSSSSSSGWDQAIALDSLQVLLSTLSEWKNHHAMVDGFFSRLQQELQAGSDISSELIVGRYPSPI